MNTNFKVDLQNAREAENIVYDVLTEMATEIYTVLNVADKEEYFNKGDIIVSGKGRKLFFDVKDDSRIADSGNILCEETVYYKDRWGRYGDGHKGFMYSEYDALAIVSKSENKIYMINFKELKQHYKKGRRITLSKTGQKSDVYLYPLSSAYKNGMVAAVLKYNFDSNKNSYVGTNILKAC